MTAFQRMTTAVDAVDHLLLGISDLDKGIAWVEKMTGVKAVIGGSHPGVGTRNALASLGGRRYLEIIAPDPAQSTFNSRHDVRQLAEPRLVTWAAVTTDIEALAKKVRGAGPQIFGPRDGSRARPDGKLLKWKTLGVQHDLGRDGFDPVPFFIEWATDSIHPSQDSPRGCELQSFEIEHPNPAGLVEALKQLGIDARARQAEAIRMVATIKTPKGTVVLT